MRDFLIFVVIAAIAFFAIGETVGWQIGVPGQTPVYVYKQDGMASATRRTIRRNSMPIEVTGEVRDGGVTVRIVYQDVGSFQTNRQARAPEVVFEETYGEGRSVNLREVFEEGAGEYSVQLHFSGATGLFRMPMPNSADL